MKRIHLNGRDIADLFSIMNFKDYLARSGKNELMSSNEIVKEGTVYYFVNNYWEVLVASLKKAVMKNAMDQTIGNRLLATIEGATDYNKNDISLTPHLFSM